MNNGRIAGLLVFLSSRPALLGALVIVLLDSACVPVGRVGDPPPLPSSAEPNTQAIVTVVQDIYSRLAQPTRVYLGAGDVEDATIARARSTLGFNLTTPFIPPSERASGNPGASVSLGRFNLEEDGQLRVVASYVEEDGAGRGCRAYTLEEQNDEWTIVGQTDAWPDCPIADYGEETYHTALQRARGDECFGKWASTGTCGPWLYVLETSGYHGTVSYFDTQSGLIVARKSFTDVAEEPDLFEFGSADCEPDITETILCDR